MSDAIGSLFGRSEKSDEEIAAENLLLAQQVETREKEKKENERRASIAKTASTIQNEGSLFPSDFASTASSTLG